jgi:cellobiose-specific phosphotransferase system component IIC
MDDGNRILREDDRAHEEWLIKEQRLTIRAMVLTLAVVIAPFLALLWGLNEALGVLALALLFTAVLCWSASNQSGPVVRGRLRTAGLLNAVMAALVVLIVILRVWG